ncbi:GGDEF domain-containing protein [Rhizobiaceae bacterium BDR2-2]|uniref:GGDEF domain-containing protein n=1 Tax=Ectorhizobium quercum TaxID=2965071 RepID=A0AAE3SX18_9HYPH|nr:GGDEF domain-containing protein [Ectorhizobium quercum]MCX8996357.1 GGDEF domain-containing protein [Ectorhizobium quercum]MCX8998604.1 GGDEF domain-containing protein [Ectorhizobium quercum]
MLSEKVLREALADLFDFSPVPFSISTIEHNSRYVKVNQAYLSLVGRSWPQLEGQSLSIDLPYGLDDPARLQRMHLLETQGFYDLAEVEMIDSGNRLIPTLISAQRRRIHGESFDIEFILDNSARKAFEHSIIEAAFTDSLTGLPNRRAFDDALAKALDRQTPQQSLVLVYIDLNGFKGVNDIYGHAVGDELLRIVAKRLRAAMNARDFVARLGGDEFAAILTVPRDRKPVASRFYELAQGIVGNVDLDGVALPVGAAVGVSVADAVATADSFLNHADSLMYLAKSSGKSIDVRIAPFMS